MARWLAGWLNGWLAGWLAILLAGWLVNSLAGWLPRKPNDWRAGWLAGGGEGKKDEHSSDCWLGLSLPRRLLAIAHGLSV